MTSNAGSAPVNPLLSNQASELQAVLHPLVLLSISDYITRHTLRGQPGPIVGGLMGQHNGREVTAEFAFDCHVVEAPDTPYQYRLDMAKLQARIEQLRTVHKDHNLDFVGWYTLLPKSGPAPGLVHLHRDILSHVNESAILLGFHPGEMLEHAVGGKLPLTVFESNYEVDDAAAKADTEGDKKMLEAGDSEAEATLKLRFREIAYTVETGEAEMISVDFVARGSGLATADEPPKQPLGKQQEGKGKGKGKGKMSEYKNLAADDDDDDDDDDENVTLSPEDEETMAALTARANATKMLHSRIQLLKAYLDRLPPTYVSGADPTARPSSTDADAEDQTTTIPSNTVLRQIQALVGRLDLVEPSDLKSFREETLREHNDVHIVSLLNNVMQSVKEVRGVGRKFDIVNGTKVRSEAHRQDTLDLSRAVAGVQAAASGKPGHYGLQGNDMVM